MTLPRWLAYVLARIGGYFWLPCPRCGRMFAGFEIRGKRPTSTPGLYEGTCCPPSDWGPGIYDFSASEPHGDDA